LLVTRHETSKLLSMNKRCLLFVALVMLVRLSGEAWLVAAPAPQRAVAEAETARPDVDTANQRDRELTAGIAGWTKYEGNPVMGGQHGTCFDISVLREGDLYRMWLSWRPKASVALVESRDGFHWSEPPRIVLGPRKDTGWEDAINRPVVLRREDGYHLWYTGQAKGHSAIGYATSLDGTTWKRVSDGPVLSPEKPWEKVAVMCPHVLWDAQAGLFRLWYSGGEQNEPNAIGYATSPDGRRWTKHPANPIFTPDPTLDWEKHKVTACQVERRGDSYLMFYIGFRDEAHAQIGLARSRDGITNWQRHPSNPIVRPGEGQWDHDACYKPYAIFDGQKWLLWYNGRHGGLEQIGVVLHPGEDLGF
jgi:beta-1,2-mannobiose phosphorylase / 1,2-beta-oligomannan phosphorylase